MCNLPDVTVTNEGNIFIFNPHSHAAKDWIAENVQENAQYYGNGLVVEHRFAGDIIEGMEADGLSLRIA
jgi:hypothetical protein